MSLPEDEIRLIQRAGRGNLGAFNRLALAYQDLVYQHMVWMLAEPETAEELTQETFLLAYRNIHSYRDGDFGCWLLRLANRLCRASLRRRGQSRNSLPDARINSGNKIAEALQPPVRVGSPLDNPGQNDPGKTVPEGLKEIPPDLRAALILVDLHGMDYLQAAGILEISPGKVKRRLARARVQLRDTLFLEEGGGSKH